MSFFLLWNNFFSGVAVNCPNCGGGLRDVRYRIINGVISVGSANISSAVHPGVVSDDLSFDTPSHHRQFNGSPQHGS